MSQSRHNPDASLRPCTVEARGLDEGRVALGYAVSGDRRRHRASAFQGPTLIVRRIIVDGAQASRGPWIVTAPNGTPVPGLKFATLRNGAGFARDLLALKVGQNVAKRGTVWQTAARAVARISRRHGGKGPATVAPAVHDLPRADAPLPIPTMIG